MYKNGPGLVQKPVKPFGFVDSNELEKAALKLAKLAIPVEHQVKTRPALISLISPVQPGWLALVVTQGPLPSSPIPPLGHTLTLPSFLLSPLILLTSPSLSPLWCLCAEEMEGLLTLSVLLSLRLLSRELSLSSSRRFNVDLSLIFFCACRALWMFYRWTWVLLSQCVFSLFLLKVVSI